MRPADASLPPEATSTRPDWQSAFLGHYDALDATLVTAGFPPTSPWWRSRIEAFRFHLRARMPCVCSTYDEQQGLLLDGG